MPPFCSTREGRRTLRGGPEWSVDSHTGAAGARVLRPGRQAQRTDVAARICRRCGALTRMSLRAAAEPSVASEPIEIGTRDAIIWTVVVVTFLVLAGWIVDWSSRTSAPHLRLGPSHGAFPSNLGDAFSPPRDFAGVAAYGDRPRRIARG
jgi:hypothetical protein